MRLVAVVVAVLAAAPAVHAQEAPPEYMRLDGEPSKGNDRARVVLVEFSDYECPYCAQYSVEVLPQITAEYVDTGKVRYVFRDYPLSIHANAAKAAEAAHCAGAQGKFWAMHDALFANPANLGPDALAAHAKKAGVEERLFAQCLASGRFAADVRQDVADGNAAGVRGTPAFLVGIVQQDGRVLIQRKLFGLRPFSDYRAVLETALATP